MEKLLVNGMGQFTYEPVKEREVLPKKKEKFVAKFKGKSPITSNGPNFLNRKK